MAIRTVDFYHLYKACAVVYHSHPPPGLSSCLCQCDPNYLNYPRHHYSYCFRTLKSPPASKGFSDCLRLSQTYLFARIKLSQSFVDLHSFQFKSLQSRRNSNPMVAILSRDSRCLQCTVFEAKEFRGRGRRLDREKRTEMSTDPPDISKLVTSCREHAGQTLPLG